MVLWVLQRYISGFSLSNSYNPIIPLVLDLKLALMDIPKRITDTGSSSCPHGRSSVDIMHLALESHPGGI